MKDVVILYHADCPDGFGGAWAAWKKFGSKADYIGVHHGAPVPDGLTGKEIYFIDFSYPIDVMKDLVSQNKKVTAIDHHVSRESAIKTTQDYLFSANNSGAVLAWQYFSADKKVPKLLEYIEDRDLYRFKLSDSRAVCVIIDSLDFDFGSWNKLADELENDLTRKSFAEKGSMIVRYEEELIKRLIDESAKTVFFEGYETFAVNAPHMFASDIGHAFYKKKPPIAIVWSEDKERVNVSLRSDGTVDVSKIAAKYGGGGHKESAGFDLPSISSFPWKDKR